MYRINSGFKASTNLKTVRLMLISSLVLLMSFWAYEKVFALPQVSIDIDVATLSSKPTFRHYNNSQIRIRQTNAADHAILGSIGVTRERSFVRLDQWKPTAGSPLNTEPNIKFGLGDSWLEDMNNRNVSPWLTQEVDAWKGDHDWFIEPPLSPADITAYQDLWYDIVLYIKQTSPTTEIVEMMNEPGLNKFRLNDNDRVNLWISNARVVNQINDELNLPNETYGPALVAGGPSFIVSNIYNNKFKNWATGVYNYDQANPGEDLKPKFFSYHDLTLGKQPNKTQDTINYIRSYLGSGAFGSYWDDMPMWNTAYSARSSGASSGGSGNKGDPSAAEMTKSAASFAAMHYYFMEAGIVEGSMFAQSNYLDYEQSLLLPEHINIGNPVSYYQHGKKTPVYNSYDILSRMSGQRVDIQLSGSNSLNSSGQGVGANTTRDTNKVMINAWNYRSANNTGYDTDVTFSLSGLAASGIDNNESATVNMYRIDNSTSNIAHGSHAVDGLELVDTFSLSSGVVRQINREISTNSVVYFEIVGNNDGSTGGDTTPPTVSLTQPTASSTLTGMTQFSASASDDVAVDYVEFLLDGSTVIGTDSTTPYTISADVNLAPFSNGAATISARVYDTSSNSSTSNVANVTIDSGAGGSSCDPSSVTNPAGNIAPNYSFEVYNENFTAGNSGTYSWPTNTSRNGNCSAQIESLDTAGSPIQQRYFGKITDIPVSAGQEYDVSGWIKTTNTTGSAYIVTNFWSGPSGSDFISGSTVASDGVVGTNDWSEVSYKTTAPAGAQYMRVELRLNGAGTVNYDDVTVRESAGSLDTTNPTISSEVISPYLSSDGLMDLAATASDDVAIDRVEFKLGGELLGTDSTGVPYNFYWDTTAVPNGNYTIDITAFDSSNNTASVSVAVKVRNTDINRDGVVNNADLTILTNSWKNTSDHLRDLNDDDTVDMYDLAHLLKNWLLSI